MAKLGEIQISSRSRVSLSLYHGEQADFNPTPSHPTSPSSGSSSGQPDQLIGPPPYNQGSADPGFDFRGMLRAELVL